LNNRLSDRLNLHSNSLNAIRLTLALLVVVFHSFPLGGFQGGASIGQMPLGTFAVASFFVVSGYLISHSRVNSQIGHFFWKRFLRIIPAYLFAYFLTAYLFSFIAGLALGGWSIQAAGLYMLRGIQFFVFGPEEIGTTLIPLPYPLSWNGSLWSVRIEALLYLATAVVFFMPRFLRLDLMVAGGFVVSASLSILFQLGVWTDPTPAGILSTLAFFVPFYLSGTLLYLWRDSIPVTKGSLLLAGFLATVSFSESAITVLASIPLGYLLLALGSLKTPRLLSHLVKNDYSYGVYVLAFPVQQTLAALGVNDFGLASFMAASVFASLAFAFLSWHLVESPALRLKGKSAEKPLKP
jgi:peptidoglycan/LPS O-acetylase OafA/YrhL